jgi:hypothetical protein
MAWEVWGIHMVLGHAMCVYTLAPEPQTPPSTRVTHPPHDEQFSIKVLFRGPKVRRMHQGTPPKKSNRPTRTNLALWNVTWSPRVLDIWEKRSKTADFDRRPWGTISKRNKTLGNATINRYFEVGTINRINRLKPVNCSTKFTAVLNLLQY